MTKKIWIVIPVHNRCAITRACLESLQGQDCQEFEIVLVDDGSTDGTGAMVQEHFPRVILLRGDGNLWWSGAMNAGIRHVLQHCQPDDAVLALNDDLVLPTDYISRLRKVAGRFPDTLIGSVTTDIKDRDVIHQGGYRVNWITAKWKVLNRGKSLASFPAGFYVDVSTLTGRGVLIPTKVFRQIGLYNDRHYPQCGDAELPRRASKAGYRLIVSYDIPAYSHTDDAGHISYKKTYRLSDLKRYLFDIRSHANLRCRFWLAYDAASNVLFGTIYFVNDFLRISYHFLKRLRFY